MISEKSTIRCTFLHLVVQACTKSFKKQGIQKNCVPEFPEYMNTYILTEGKNLKTIPRENYAIALDSCYLFAEKILNMVLIVVGVSIY